MSVVAPACSSTILMPVRVRPGSRTKRSSMPSGGEERLERRRRCRRRGSRSTVDRDPQRGQHGGHVHALAARRHVVALDAVDLAGAEPGDPHGVVERRVGGDRRRTVERRVTAAPAPGPRRPCCRPAPAAARRCSRRASVSTRRRALTAATAGTLTDSSRTPRPVRISAPSGSPATPPHTPDPDAGRRRRPRRSP